MDELKKDSVERTLCIPLWSRAIAVKKLPQILPDHDAVRILKEMGEKRPPTIFYNMECGALAGAIRQYDFACEINDYLQDHPDATIVELGAGLSCLRRQLNNENNRWINIDLPDVIACREKYIPIGDKEENIAFDLRDHKWFEEVGFEKEKGAIFLAAGVLHYLYQEDVQSLIDEMAKRFPGAVFVFDYVSNKGSKSGNAQIAMTGNNTRILFSMQEAKELYSYSNHISDVIEKSYLEGYPVKGVNYNPITRLYIRSKRDQYFVVRIKFEE